MKIFGVDYRFHAAGDVFTHGLAYAANDIGVSYDHADVNDPALVSKVEAFAPDVVFVVHGRHMARRKCGLLNRYPSAVWLLDEPYEVDDTAKWSHRFGHVFVNDPATVDRHPNASVLPTCYDPGVHYPGDNARVFRVGFIGGTNDTREMYLDALGDRLDVLVGDFRRPTLARRVHKTNVRPNDAADLYRHTLIVVNVFRDVHHFNERGTIATALNPRVYEATACGALVVSDRRPELADIAPSVPVFGTPDELVAIVDAYLADPDALALRASMVRAELASHTYADRLRTVLAVVGADRPVGVM